jgi:aldose 1-epimerase
MDPCGEHFTITSGAARAAVSEVGAGLRYFAVGDTLYTEPVPDGARPPRGSGALLAPWPNRVAKGRWTWEDGTQQLPLTELPAGNAIHGLLRQTFWSVVEHTESAITLRATVAPQNGWPQPVTVAVTYSVDGQGLTVSTTATNEGGAPIPFGLGFHPYLRIGDTPTADCTLTLAARAQLPLTDQLPSGPLAQATTTFDLADARLDDAFGDCALTDGLVRHTLTGPDGGVELWADPAFGWVQVFTPSDMPQHGKGVAVEPMTCPPDALNSGTDLQILAPGASWTGRWGLTPR